MIVVNCFHFVSLKYWKQYFHCWVSIAGSCELLSFCIFEILKTVHTRQHSLDSQLWIAFILYLWNIENSKTIRLFSQPPVVNCFHFVSLKYWKQYLLLANHRLLRCELLSFCIFEILKTVFQICHKERMVLWIAFILYLWNIENSWKYLWLNTLAVVNCFHFVSLKYWKQFLPIVMLQ